MRAIEHSRALTSPARAGLTLFPVATPASDEQKRDLEHRLDSQAFMTSFWIDDDNDVVVDYPVSYSHGLLAGQFVTVLRRFGSMLDFFIRAKNDDGFILFGSTPPRPEEDDDTDPDALRGSTREGARLLN